MRSLLVHDPRRALLLGCVIIMLIASALGLVATAAEARVECVCDGTIMICDIYSEAGELTGFVIWPNHPNCRGGGSSS